MTLRYLQPGVIEEEDINCYLPEILEEGHLYIPENITSIENNAFSGCPTLAHLIISGSSIEIGQEAFSDCTNLWQVIIKGIPKFGKNAFMNCKKLREVLIHTSPIDNLEFDVFSGCDKELKIKFQPEQ